MASIELFVFHEFVGAMPAPRDGLTFTLNRASTPTRGAFGNLFETNIKVFCSDPDLRARIVKALKPVAVLVCDHHLTARAGLPPIKVHDRLIFRAKVPMGVSVCSSIVGQGGQEVRGRKTRGAEVLATGTEIGGYGGCGLVSTRG